MAGARVETLGAVPARPAPSFWSAAWRRFRSNRVALVSALFLLAVHLVAVAAPILTPYDPNEVDIGSTHARPSARHLLGTDENGRDVLSRLIVGSQATLSVGLVSMAIAVVVGALAGGISGYLGGIVDSVLMRFTDGMMSIPNFFLVLVVVAVFGSKLEHIVLTIGLTSWMLVARVVRGEVLRYREQDFVLAARALGATGRRILFLHIMPHTMPAIIVSATLGVATAILVESALSYLGLGIQPPQASWGNMLSNSQAYLFQNPLLPVYPGLLIFLTVLAYNFVGDALRDALDPRIHSD